MLVDFDFLLVYILLPPENSVLNTSDSNDPSLFLAFSFFFPASFITKTIKNYNYFKLL